MNIYLKLFKRIAKATTLAISLKKKNNDFTSWQQQIFYLSSNYRWHLRFPFLGIFLSKQLYNFQLPVLKIKNKHWNHNWNIFVTDRTKL